MKKYLKKSLIWLLDTKAYTYIFSKILPYVRFSFWYSAIKGKQYRHGYALLKTGDIVLNTDKHKLLTILVPGDFSHAALCVKKDSDFEIAEMTNKNFGLITFMDFCKEADRVVILRCNDFDESYINKVVEKCMSFKDCEYDYHFSLGVKALYCSELVYQSDFENKLKVSLEDVDGLGVPYISPSGLYKAKNVTVIWDSDLDQ